VATWCFELPRRRLVNTPGGRKEGAGCDDRGVRAEGKGGRRVVACSCLSSVYYQSRSRAKTQPVFRTRLPAFRKVRAPVSLSLRKGVGPGRARGRRDVFSPCGLIPLPIVSTLSNVRIAVRFGNADVAQWQSTAFVKPGLWVQLPPSASSVDRQAPAATHLGEQSAPRRNSVRRTCAPRAAAKQRDHHASNGATISVERTDGRLPFVVALAGASSR
jgi:hypothetical protein